MMKLNLGCGNNWKIDYPDFDGLDIVNFGQKYVCDVLGFESEINYSEVMANHFLEHFSQDELKQIFSNVYEILEFNGLFKIVVPHKDKERSWILSHKTFWTEDTFKVLEEDIFERYGFGKWKVEKLVTNDRLDIHCWLKKV